MITVIITVEFVLIVYSINSCKHYFRSYNMVFFFYRFSRNLCALTKPTRKFMKKIILLLAVSAILFSFYRETSSTTDFKSSSVQVHGGKAWSSIKLNKDGSPAQLSLVFDNKTLNNLPMHSAGHGHSPENDFIIPLHKKASEATPFKFVMLNWNPNGHEPAGIYDLPHFDVHFYMTSAEEVMNYTDTVKIDHKLPAADYFPAKHMAVAGVPMMGKHWIDVTSGELNGQKFTQTFIYGSYDSKVVFYEPMITLDFLKKTSKFERPIPVPAKFQKPGYYPTKMRVVKHDGVTEVLLDGFVKRQAS